MPNQTESTNRIVYADPNDTYGVYVKGPDNKDIMKAEQAIPQEDLCIAFNLTIRNFSRFKQSSGETEDFTISWSSPPSRSYQASFMAGTDFGKSKYDDDNNIIEDAPRYLSTYYTDIGFDYYGTKRIVEGLGVSSVEVSWESWYTPTVVIKFVDVRGSAIWGNEEAIHENGKVTVDNVFGCFFTQPYPLFTLMMKGFLGKAVSYQLTLTDFRGEYNSNTGDFEATATFIGYTYSLLTDIPMAYILAAPYCDYVGKAYWDQHCNDPEWRLADGKAPIRLQEFFNYVKGAKPELVEGMTAITDEESNELTNIANKRETLRALRNNLDDFITAIARSSETYLDYSDTDDGGSKLQLVLMYSGENQYTTEATKTAFNKLYSTLTEYNNCFTDSAIPLDSLPNGWRSCPNNLTAIRFLAITTNANSNETTVRLVGNNGRESTLNNIKALKFNDRRKLITQNARYIYDVIHKRTANKNSLREYAYIVDIDGLITRINAQQDILRYAEDNVKTAVNNRLATQVETLVKIKPFIGNIFKIIMCHLETFLQIMFSAGKEIESQASNGLRSPSYLNITMSETDIPNNKCNYIVAWPKVINHGVSGSDISDVDSARNVIGWVGDFSHNFIEEKVVLSIEAALRKISETYENTATENESHFVPLVPSDFLGDTSPYNAIAGDLNPSSLAGYVGIRAFQTLGVFCGQAVANRYAQLLGCIDAYNLYYSSTASSLRSKVVSQLGNGANGTTLIEIALCNREYDDVATTAEGSETRHHDFETVSRVAYDQSGRHPIIANSSNEYVFAHYYNNAKISLIPSKLISWPSYSNTFEYVPAQSYASCYFKPVNEGEYQWMSPVSTKNIVGWDYDYINNAMFTTITDTESVKNALDIYELLKGGSVQVGGATLQQPFDDLLNQFWFVTDKHFYGWYAKTNLSRNRSSLEVDETKLLPLNGETSSSVSFSNNSRWLHNGNNNVNGCETGFTVPGSDDEYTATNLTIQQFDIWVTSSLRGNLFGCPFYYMQNAISNSETRLYVKALLFLSSLKFDYAQVTHCFKSSKNSGSFEAVPYAYLLFLGAILWRRRTARNADDPIVWQEGTTSYKTADTEWTLLIKGGDAKYRFSVIKSGDTGRNYNVPLSSIFGGGEYWEPDLNIQNQLIKLFKNFTNNEFVIIKNKLEIAPASGSTYTHSSLVQHIRTLADTISRSGDSEAYSWLRTNIKGWAGVYRMIVPSNNEIFNMLTEETLDEIYTTKEIYTRECLILDGCWRRLYEDGDGNVYNEVKIDRSVYSKYVGTFINTISSILQAVRSTEVVEQASPAGSRKLEANRDICISIYKYCKNLWDKWLIPKMQTEEDTKSYNVENFFTNNFMFMDSFYRNAYDKLALNCNILEQVNEGLEGSSMLLTYIDQVLTRHHCMFFSLPDYLTFSDYASTNEKMKDLFKAIPYNTMIKGDCNSSKESDQGKPNNKFVIIWLEPSEIVGKGGDYSPDYFDIWSRSMGTAAAPAIFSASRTEEEFGNYYVPSFGVAVNRQNNHIFKSLKVSMNNPVMTEQAAKALENAYKLGGQGERRVVFHGQDIYNIYSNYSYTCDVEMMGNAQIWPLLYFQLLNVPMWRGTYMVYKVTHSMTPGSMITRFSGMKLTNTPMGFANQFFSIVGEDSAFDDYKYERSVGYFSGEYPDMQETYKKAPTALSDHFSKRFNWTENKVIPAYRINGATVTVSQRLRELYNSLYEEILLLDENGNGNESERKWNVMIDKIYATDRPSHTNGLGMDLTITRSVHEDTYQTPVGSTEAKKELFTVADLLFCNHRTEIGEVNIEYSNNGKMHEGEWYNITRLHVSVFQSYAGQGRWLISSTDKGYDCINKGVSGNWFLENVPPHFRRTASRCWNNDRTNFKRTFPNYNIGGWDDDTLTDHFSTFFSGTGTFSTDMIHNIPIVMRILVNFFPVAIAKGICANMMRESSLNPKAYNPNDNGRQSYGICQWNQGRVAKIISYTGRVYNKITDIPLEDQVRAAVKEMNTGDGGNVYTYFNRNKGISAEVASDYFMLHFERPAESDEVENKRKNREFIQQINQVWNPSS